eukprot:5921502-Prymnesium_polylepis.1
MYPGVSSAASHATRCSYSISASHTFCALVSARVKVAWKRRDLVPSMGSERMSTPPADLSTLALVHASAVRWRAKATKAASAWALTPSAHAPSAPATAPAVARLNSARDSGACVCVFMNRLGFDVEPRASHVSSGSRAAAALTSSQPSGEAV